MEGVLRIVPDISSSLHMYRDPHSYAHTSVATHMQTCIYTHTYHMKIGKRENAQGDDFTDKFYQQSKEQIILLLH